MASINQSKCIVYVKLLEINLSDSDFFHILQCHIEDFYKNTDHACNTLKTHDNQLKTTECFCRETGVITPFKIAEHVDFLSNSLCLLPKKVCQMLNLRLYRLASQTESITTAWEIG